MCKYCGGFYGHVKDIVIEKSPLDKDTQPNKAQIVQCKDDTPGIILYRYGLAQGYFDINYCPMCGRKL